MPEFLVAIMLLMVFCDWPWLVLPPSLAVMLLILAAVWVTGGFRYQPEQGTSAGPRTLATAEPAQPVSRGPRLQEGPEGVEQPVPVTGE